MRRDVLRCLLLLCTSHIYWLAVAEIPGECILFDSASHNVSCYGAGDGSASVVVTRGSGPFLYFWSPTNSTSHNVTGLSPGRYTVTIEDRLGCMVSDYIQIYEPPAITMSLVSYPVTCQGRSDGSVIANATGGVSPYTYNNSDGQIAFPSASSYTFANLKATVTVQTPPITIYDESLNTQVFSDWSWAPDRTMRSTVMAHTGIYSISYVPIKWDGLYFHCNACLNTDTYTGVSFWVNGAEGGQMFQFAVSDTNSVYGARNFYGLDYPKAVLPPYTWIQFYFDFSWVLPVTGPFSGFRIEDFSGLTNNTAAYFDDIYVVPRPIERPFVVVADANGCSLTENYLIETIPAMSVEVSVETPPCYGATGNVQANVVFGGTSPFSYVWIPSYVTGPYLQGIKATAVYSTEPIFSDLLVDGFVDSSVGTASSYDTTIFFRGTTSVKFSPYLFGFILFTTAQTINVTEYYGIEFWMYSVGGNQNISFGLASYNVTKIDTYSPVVLRGLLVNAPSIPRNQWVKAFYDFSALNNSMDYNAVLIQNAGNAQYPVYFDEISLIQKAPNPGYDPTEYDYYRVEVSDSNGCTVVQDTITVGQPEELTVAVSSTFITCQGIFNGQFIATAEGGTQPYDYNWYVSANQKSLTFDNPVISGQSPSLGYAVVQDTNNCSITSNVVWIRQPPSITYSYTSQPVTCHGNSDGIITFSAQGGVPPYSLNLPSSFVSTYLNLLPVYIYSEQLLSPFVNASLPESGNLRDSSVVAQSGYYSISFMTGNFEAVGLHCNGCIETTDYLGISFWVFIEGGESVALEFGVTCGMDMSANYSDTHHSVFSVTNWMGNWTEVAYNLSMNSTGTWDTFYVRDASGPGTPSVRVYIDTIEFIPRWYSTKPDTTNVPSGFQGTFKGSAAHYGIVVTDQNGCSSPANVIITQPDALQLNFSLKPASTKYSADGKITALVSGGVPPYVYTWGQLAQYGPTATGLVIGSYYVEVKDANGCSVVQTVVLSPDGTSIVSDETAVTVALSAVVAFCFFVGVFALVLLIAKPTSYTEKTPLFCRVIHAGVLIGYTAAAVALPKPTDHLCVVFPWLVGISFTLVYGCLFLKTWRIFWILRAAKKLTKISLSNLYICRLLGIYFAFEITYLIVWTTIDPPKAQLVDVINGGQQLQCNSNHWGLFWGLFLGYKFLWMLFGAIMAIGSRFIYERFNESKQIYYCIYNSVAVAIVCVPLIVVLRNVPYAFTIIEVVFILLIFTFTLVALFFNVWMTIIFGDEDELVSNLRKRNFGQPPLPSELSKKHNSHGSNVSSKKYEDTDSSSIMTPTGTVPTIFTDNNTPPKFVEGESISCTVTTHPPT